MEKTKYSELIYQENLLLKRILNITLIPPQDDKLVKMYTGTPVYSREINELLYNGLQSLMENQSVFDTLISNLLGEDNIDGLSMLTKAYHSITDEKNKSINSNEKLQQFLSFFKEIIINYFVLVLTNPDVFPTMLPQPPNEEEGIDLSSWRF